MNDNVTLRVNGREWNGWTSVRIGAGVERLARDFSVEITRQWPGDEGIYGYIDYLAMNMLPDLCDESWLARHAAMKRCPRKEAMAASGYMRWEGVSDGLKVTAGSVIQRDDLVQYTATADATSTGGVLRVPIACSSAGAVGNADDGTSLNHSIIGFSLSHIS